MKGDVSGYVCNHGSPSGERDTASPGLWAMLRTQASDEEADDVSSPAALILWYAGSDVMGCRRPTGGVFSYVSSDRVTLRAFPVATPRGRSVSFPTRGTMVTYVTWDVCVHVLVFSVIIFNSFCLAVYWKVLADSSLVQSEKACLRQIKQKNNTWDWGACSNWLNTWIMTKRNMPTFSC